MKTTFDDLIQGAIKRQESEKPVTDDRRKRAAANNRRRNDKINKHRDLLKAKLSNSIAKDSIKTAFSSRVSTVKQSILVEFWIPRYQFTVTIIPVDLGRTVDIFVKVPIEFYSHDSFTFGMTMGMMFSSSGCAAHSHTGDLQVRGLHEGDVYQFIKRFITEIVTK